MASKGTGRREMLSYSLFFKRYYVVICGFFWPPLCFLRIDHLFLTLFLREGSHLWPRHYECSVNLQGHRLSIRNLDDVGNEIYSLLVQEECL